jgi:hypothetical protein
MTSTQGVRLPDATFNEPGPGWDAWREAPPGAYMKVTGLFAEPVWYVRDPNGRIGRVNTWTDHNLPQPDHFHVVTEHEDGTITCAPSLDAQRTGGWHGFLEHGVWTGA